MEIHRWLKVVELLLFCGGPSFFHHIRFRFEAHGLAKTWLDFIADSVAVQEIPLETDFSMLLCLGSAFYSHHYSQAAC